jgi:hypothetical protein
MDINAITTLAGGSLVPKQARFTIGAPVGDSDDLRRVLALPRRQLNPYDPLAAQLWTKHLRRERTTPCDCAQRWPNGCITDLRPVQGWALEEASDAGGLIASIGVGDGKTGIDILLSMAIPGVQSAVLLIPPSLRHQLLTRDFPQWSQHFKVPNLAGGSEFVVGRPTLHVITYSELSQTKNTDLLRRFPPDLIIADEMQNLKDTSSARTIRFLRAFAAKSSTKFAGQSGTITTKSINDNAHLLVLALREKAPVPVHPPVVNDWATAIDPIPVNSPPGALLRLCNAQELTLEPLEAVRAAYARRLRETHGYVATTENRLECSLTISERKTDVPRLLRDVIREVRETQTRPDGEYFVEKMQVSVCCRQLSAGFFYRWKFPRWEPPETIERWRAVRKEWFREIRQRLESPAEHMDSPGNLTKAALRWVHGYRHEGKLYPPHTRNGPLPTWATSNLTEWIEVKDTVYHETEPVWISEWLVLDVLEWLRQNKGIVWYDFDAFGQLVYKRARQAGIDVGFFGRGREASIMIERERGDRPIIASEAAHGTGKNLQYAFSKNLFPNPAPDGWEQTLGRTHRQGQPRDEVTAEIYRHLEFGPAFDRAQERARYTQALEGPKKLCYATYDLDT